MSCVQDSQSYAKTLAALQTIEADEILLHDGTRGKVLSTKVVGSFHGAVSRVLFVSRQYFDQDKVSDFPQVASKLLPSSRGQLAPASRLMRSQKASKTQALLPFHENVAIGGKSIVASAVGQERGCSELNGS